MIRTHFEAAVVGGCIPIIFDLPDMGGSFRGRPGPTQWPWRRAVPGLAALTGGAAAARATNFSRFCGVEQARELVRANASSPMGHLVEGLRAVAASRPVRAMQRHLDAAAPLLGQYRVPMGARCPRDNGGAPCDAFGLLAMYLKELSVRRRKAFARGKTVHGTAFPRPALL